MLASLVTSIVLANPTCGDLKLAYDDSSCCSVGDTATATCPTSCGAKDNHRPTHLYYGVDNWDPENESRWHLRVHIPMSSSPYPTQQFITRTKIPYPRETLAKRLSDRMPLIIQVDGSFVHHDNTEGMQNGLPFGIRGVYADLVNNVRTPFETMFVHILMNRKDSDAGGYDTAELRRAVQWCIKSLPVDLDNVFVIAYSSGSRSFLRYVTTYDEDPIIKSAVLVGPSVSESETSAYLSSSSRVPLYFLGSVEDNGNVKGETIEYNKVLFPRMVQEKPQNRMTFFAAYNTTDPMKLPDTFLEIDGIRDEMCMFAMNYNSINHMLPGCVLTEQPEIMKRVPLATYGAPFQGLNSEFMNMYTFFKSFKTPPPPPPPGCPDSTTATPNGLSCATWKQTFGGDCDAALGQNGITEEHIVEAKIECPSACGLVEDSTTAKPNGFYCHIWEEYFGKNCDGALANPRISAEGVRDAKLNCPRACCER